MFYAARVDEYGDSASGRAVDELEIDRNAILIPMGRAIQEERVVKTK